MSRLLSWLLIIVLVVIVIGAVALLFIDIPYQPTRVEQPVSDEILGL